MPPRLVTLFDRAYAARGMVMLDSLAAMAPTIAGGGMTVHALDAEAEAVARTWSAGHPWLEVRSPGSIDVLDPGLGSLRRKRSPAAFCWTLTPLVLRHALRSGVEQAVYVDADLVFHSDPLPALAHLATSPASVHITPHGFPSHADRSASVGRYCVQFLPVRNDPAGRMVVDDWARDCLADCPEAGGDRPPGDQGYLDAWPRRYGDAVADWDEAGVGCGPWNRSRHRLRRRDGRLEVSRDDGPWSSLLFFHHQDVKWDAVGHPDLARLLSWPLPLAWLRHVTVPYLAAVAAGSRRWDPAAPRHPDRRLPCGFWPRWLRDQLLPGRR